MFYGLLVVFVRDRLLSEVRTFQQLFWGQGGDTRQDLKRYEHCNLVQKAFHVMMLPCILEST